MSNDPCNSPNSSFNFSTFKKDIGTFSKVIVIKSIIPISLSLSHFTSWSADVQSCRDLTQQIKILRAISPTGISNSDAKLISLAYTYSCIFACTMTRTRDVALVDILRSPPTHFATANTRCLVTSRHTSSIFSDNTLTTSDVFPYCADLYVTLYYSKRKYYRTCLLIFVNKKKSGGPSLCGSLTDSILLVCCLSRKY